MTITPFALLCQICGLSHREAAGFLDVRPDTVKSWSAGRNPAPAGVVARMSELAEAIDAAADEAVSEIEARAADIGSPPEAVELGLAADDAEALSLGWPCVGAHRMVLALTLARALAEGHGPFEIVPRGSTVATAAAADTHRK